MKIDEFGMPLFEMANIGPKTHKFGIDVKLNILQPGDRKISHGPRIKVFRGDKDFSITLNKDASKMKIVGKSFLSPKETKTVLTKVSKYRNAFLNFWNNQQMTTDELREEMDAIDNN